ncbi:MAG: site-specific integrase [Bacteroidales bacterium]|nr:site-specific integrase [Bacteroidales bacterium]
MEFQRAKAVNKKIDRCRKLVENYYEEKSAIDADELREKLDIFMGKKKEVKEDSRFTTYFKLYLGTNVAKSNIKSYTTTYRAICELMPDSVEIGKVDYSYLEKFQRLFQSRKIKRYKNKEGRLPSLNYSSLQIKNIKTVLHDFQKKGITISGTIDDYTKVEEEADSIYLSMREIEELHNLDLPKRLAKARNIFLVGCCTAMRISDYKTLSKDNIRDGMIFKTTKKKSQRVVVPIHHIAREILESYDYKLPKLSETKLNKYIKEVGKIAGMDEPIIITKTEGGKKVARTFKKYELITTHTARRSGATNMYLSGIPSISIMMITGHKTEKAFLKYIKVTKEQNAQVLANHEYFQGKLE